MVTESNLPYLIRRMKPKDIPTVVQLDHQVFKDPWPRAAYIYELYFNPNARYFVLQMKGYPSPDAIQGFVGMRVEEQRGHISTLAIHPEWRGQGLGEVLFIAALKQALTMKAATVVLEVRVFNKVAQNLYFKYGFVAKTRFTGYYQDGEDAFQLELEIGEDVKSYAQTLQTRCDCLEKQIITGALASKS